MHTYLYVITHECTNYLSPHLSIRTTNVHTPRMHRAPSIISCIIIFHTCPPPPIRMKEEYVEGVISSPVVAEGRVPLALKGVVDQLGAAVSNLPEGMREAIGNGFKVSLGGEMEGGGWEGREVEVGGGKGGF